MYDQHSLKSKLARVTEELEETKDELESVNSILEHTQHNYEWHLQRQKENTKREEEAEFQKRIDIIEGALGEMTI